MQKSPFKFLDSYSKEDRDIFFGRDREIEELHSRVFQSKILIVYGISGTGKSSLINCGLANKFNDSDWLPVNVRRGANINQSLVEGLIKNSLTTDSNLRAKNDPVKLLRSIYLDHFKPVFLIFDQFEEMFIFGNKTERDEFISTVKKITDSDLQCRFIFSVREEYLAGFTEFEKTIPSFLANRIRIEKMTRQNAMRAIEGPCETNNIKVEEGFSEALLDKLNPESPDVELTYLQVFLDKLFRLVLKLEGEVRNISKEHLGKAGDVKDLLESFLEEQIALLDNPSDGLIILKSFVSVKGTKHQIAEDEVIEYSRTLGQDIQSAIVRDMIQKFIGLRILRDKDESGRYELRHDVLASIIYEKITLVEKELLEIRQFIENSFATYEKRNLYLSEDDLQYIAPYEDKLFLGEQILEFISLSKNELHRKKRRRQNVLIVTVAVIFAVLSFFTVWAFREKGNALDQKVFAEQQKDAALNAKAAADSAKQQALISRNLAMEKEAIAIVAQKQSDQARKEALAEREYALLQRTLAEKLSVTANDQARIATDEKIKAEQERKKAVEAEATALRIGNLSKAQNYALSCLSYDKTPGLMGKLAYSAYDYNKNNNGPVYDPVIYEALSSAWLVLDSSRHSVFMGSESEIRSITDRGNNTIMTADLDGKIRMWSADGKIISTILLPIMSPVNFIQIDRSSGKIISQHDNKEIRIWRIKADKSNEYESILLDNKGFIKSADFCENGRYLVTGGIDSLVSVWDLEPPRAENIKSLNVSSEIISVLFNGPDTLLYACEDGSINLLKTSDNESILIHPPEAIKPLCMVLTDIQLFVGYQDGCIRMFNRKSQFRFSDKNVQHKAGIDLMAFSSDFSLFATASRDKSIRLYYVNEYFTQRNIYGGVVHFKDLPGRVRSLEFTNDNKLVAGLSDRTIRIWETSSEKLANMIHGFLKNDTSLATNQ